MANKKPTPAKYKTADSARKAATNYAEMLRNESPEDRAYRKLMEKYNYDITKIPGWKGGGGTQ